MKTTLLCGLLALALVRCGNATDGDARTDTTTLMVDTGAAARVNDTAALFNTRDGSYPADTMSANQKGDVRSSAPSDPGSRNTPGADTARQRQ